MDLHKKSAYMLELEKKTIFFKQSDFDLIYSAQFFHAKIQNTNTTQHHTSVQQVRLGIWNRGFIIRRIIFDNPMRKVLCEAIQVEIIFLVEMIWTINHDDVPSDAGKKSDGGQGLSHQMLLPSGNSKGDFKMEIQFLIYSLQICWLRLRMFLDYLELMWTMP